MKKLLLLSLLIFSNYVYSQNYKPLLDDYNEWHLEYCFLGNCSTDVYRTNGDTLVDGFNFKVLDGYHYISRSFLLREDVAEKKVYLKAFLPIGEKDALLYDFSLEVGDSIDMKNPATPFPENAGYYTVASIELLPLVDGNNYKHFYLSPSVSNTTSINDAIWVEGVGSLSIINAPSGDPDINGVGRVACMFKNGVAFYSDLDIINDCEAIYILDTPEYGLNTSNIKVINTINSNEFEILNIADFNTIEVYNLQGSKIDAFNKNHQNSLHLDLSNYQSAMYFLVLKSNEQQSHTVKIIVQ